MILKNKILMITGGTGSFGTSVLNYFLNSPLKEIRIFSRDERKQEFIRQNINNNKVTFHIGDVRDTSSLDNAMKNVDFVFHAAALKQVPSCEFHPLEALKTNTLGTENTINAAINHKVKKFILLSTDKAVYPINAMGISKAMAERIMLSKAKEQSNKGTILCATRYGNVIASRGSVIPLFISQIKNNLPITITDTKMTRFLMTLEQSVKLVGHALEYGKQGDIFVKKSPSATVGNIAKSLLQIYNKKNEIKIIGTRHGEKLYETLISREEMNRAKINSGYFKITADFRDINYDNFVHKGKKSVSKLNDYTSHNTERLSLPKIRSILKNIKLTENL